MDETNATSKDVREIESDLSSRIMLDMKMVTSLDMSVL